MDEVVFTYINILNLYKSSADIGNLLLFSNYFVIHYSLSLHILQNSALTVEAMPFFVVVYIPALVSWVFLFCIDEMAVNEEHCKHRQEVVVVGNEVVVVGNEVVVVGNEVVVVGNEVVVVGNEVVVVGNEVVVVGNEVVVVGNEVVVVGNEWLLEPPSFSTIQLFLLLFFTFLSLHFVAKLFHFPLKVDESLCT